MRTVQGKVVGFELQPGRRIGSAYEVVQRLGAGTEGEVYQIVETATGIHRAAKLYFPHCNPTGRTTVWYAKKLNNLRNCPIVLQYYHTEQIQVARQKVLCLISEFCEGIPVAQWVAQQKGGRLSPYMALHLLYQLVLGLEEVHAVGEYHADVHSENILVQPRGVRFHLKLFDFYNWGRHARYKQSQDILDSIGVFSEVLGGKVWVARLPEEIRYICGAERSNVILRRFPNMTTLRMHLETFDWFRLD